MLSCIKSKYCCAITLLESYFSTFNYQPFCESSMEMNDLAHFLFSRDYPNCKTLCKWKHFLNRYQASLPKGLWWKSNIGLQVTKPLRKNCTLLTIVIFSYIVPVLLISVALNIPKYFEAKLVTSPPTIGDPLHPDNSTEVLFETIHWKEEISSHIWKI